VPRLDIFVTLYNSVASRAPAFGEPVHSLLPAAAASSSRDLRDTDAAACR